MTAKPLSLLATIALVAAVLYLFLTHQLFGVGPVSIGLQAAALLLMLWARLTFGWRSFHAAANPTAGGLVTHGPYRYLRHPIYVAIWLFTWTGIAVHLSIETAVAGLVIAVTLLARMLSEEEMLRLRYPEYVDYSRRAKRLVPFLY